MMNKFLPKKSWETLSLTISTANYAKYPFLKLHIRKGELVIQKVIQKYQGYSKALY